jgi:hypothetical protein
LVNFTTTLSFRVCYISRVSHQEDLTYLSARLLLFEQWLCMIGDAQQMFPRFADEFEPARVVLEREIENLEYCLRRDRKNHDKPD